MTNTDNIKALETLISFRESETGYLVNKKAIELSFKHSQGLTVVPPYSNRTFDPYIKQAIEEMGDELIKRAFEIEEERFNELKVLAAQEAEVLAEELRR